MEFVARVASDVDRFQAFTAKELRDRDRAIFAAMADEIGRLKLELRAAKANARQQHRRAELWRHRCLDGSA